MSPGFHPLNNDDYMAEARRPSVASTSTMSSTGSGKKSVSGMPGRFHKKLQGFFGDEFDTSEERQNSDTSLQTSQMNGARHGSQPERSGSLMDGRPSSRASSIAKPKEQGQGPSSEVTPWVFQDSSVSKSLTQCSHPFPDMPGVMILTMVVVLVMASYQEHFHMHNTLSHQHLGWIATSSMNSYHFLSGSQLINSIPGCAEIVTTAFVRGQRRKVRPTAPPSSSSAYSPASSKS